jgi:NTP pyrophosphatase (non-canonical NTP hydrolase)
MSDYEHWMGDLVDSLDALAVAIQKNKIAKGWQVTSFESWDDPNQIPADLALIHSELSEALEAFRIDSRPKFAEELADVMIRLIGLAAGLDIDLGNEVLAKMRKNADRPIRHGGKKL